MSKKFAVTQTFNIESSRFLINWLFALHAIAILATFTNSLSIVYKIILLIGILVSLIVQLKREDNFKGLILRYSEVTGWEITSLENQFSSIQILPSTVITHYLIVEGKI